MIKIYKPLSLDWLNYKVTPSNKITYHHIVKREHGGKIEFDNGALLSETGHQYLHIIEYKEIETYIALNKLFKIINQQRTAPTREQREIIEYLLSSFEVEHKNDKNSKGKLLIKHNYLKRF